MKEIRIKIKGGLGNQLFQYAYAKKLKMEYKDAKLILDISYFNKKRIRNIDINKYILDDVVYEKKEKFIFAFLYYIYRVRNRIKKKFNKKYGSKSYYLKKSVYVFHHGFFNEKLKLENKEKLFLAGYFQLEKEISTIIEDIRKDLTLINPLGKNAVKILSKLQSSKNSIGISIRIGEDYKKCEWPICKKEYYISGLEYLMKEIKDPNIFIFSDEIEKVKNEGWFKDYKNVIYVEKCNAVEGLEIMRKCQNFVIANSTYSWWGAYLSEYANKKIIAPKYFYNNNVLMKDVAISIPNAIYFDNDTGK